MNAVERITVELAGHFAIEPVPLINASAFRYAVKEALSVMTEEKVIAGIVALGLLRSARDPYAVLIGRARRLVDDATIRTRLVSEQAEAARWRLVDVATHRGETLRALVDRGGCFVDEAHGCVQREFADEDLRAIALAALEKGSM